MTNDRHDQLIKFSAAALTGLLAQEKLGGENFSPVYVHPETGEETSSAAVFSTRTSREIRCALKLTRHQAIAREAVEIARETVEILGQEQVL